MNHYETVFILTPVLSAEQMKEAVEKFEKILTPRTGACANWLTPSKRRQQASILSLSSTLSPR